MSGLWRWLWQQPAAVVRDVLEGEYRDYHLCGKDERLWTADLCQQELKLRLAYELHTGYVSERSLLEGTWLTVHYRDEGHQHRMRRLANVARDSELHPQLNTRHAYTLLMKELQFDALDEHLKKVVCRGFRERDELEACILQMAGRLLSSLEITKFVEENWDYYQELVWREQDRDEKRAQLLDDLWQHLDTFSHECYPSLQELVDDWRSLSTEDILGVWQENWECRD